MRYDSLHRMILPAWKIEKSISKCKAMLRYAYVFSDLH